MIIVRTPFRISFFGGGTDYPAWFREHGGAVLATTIDKFCYLSCRNFPPFFDAKYRIVYSETELTQEIAEIRHPAVRACLSHVALPNGVEVSIVKLCGLVSTAPPSQSTMMPSSTGAAAYAESSSSGYAM